MTLVYYCLTEKLSTMLTVQTLDYIKKYNYSLAMVARSAGTMSFCLILRKPQAKFEQLTTKKEEKILCNFSRVRKIVIVYTSQHIH